SCDCPCLTYDLLRLPWKRLSGCSVPADRLLTSASAPAIVAGRAFSFEARPPAATVPSSPEPASLGGDQHGAGAPDVWRARVGLVVTGTSARLLSRRPVPPAARARTGAASLAAGSGRRRPAGRPRPPATGPPAG